MRSLRFFIALALCLALSVGLFFYTNGNNQKTVTTSLSQEKIANGGIERDMQGYTQNWYLGAGPLFGAYLSSELGKSLDDIDKAYNQQAVEKTYTAPLNQTNSWNNPQTGHHGTVTPLRQGRNAQTGLICRQYKQQVVLGSEQTTALGLACQNADGSWSVIP